MQRESSFDRETFEAKLGRGMRASGEREKKML